MTKIAAPKPQYVQVADELRSRIKDGTYGPGTLLPSEDRLAEELGLSRVTINRALGLLRASGDVKVKRGLGTIVGALPRIVRDAQARYSARRDGTGAGEVEARRLNLRSHTEYGDIRKVNPPERVASVLDLEKRDSTLLRPRVLYANDEPTQIANSYLPWSLVRNCSELMQADSGEGGSYGRLADIGYGPVRFTEDVTVRMPSAEEQDLLELEPVQPVFEIWHVAYTAKDRPIEVCIHVMPGHLWQLRYAWDDRAPDDSPNGTS
ncbi:MAG TPA: GntR family transcriptional regulator [Polyangiaceae bacterium]